MEDSAFSDDFCRFLQTTVPSVEAAEVLLQLYGGAQWWDVPALVASLRPATSITEAEALRHIEQFQARGLITVGPDKRVQFLPATEELREQVATLARAYRERPVTLIRMIYALRDTKVQSFADAFKLRR